MMTVVFSQCSTAAQEYASKAVAALRHITQITLQDAVALAYDAGRMQGQEDGRWLDEDKVPDVDPTERAVAREGFFDVGKARRAFIDLPVDSPDLNLDEL